MESTIEKTYKKYYSLIEKIASYYAQKYTLNKSDIISYCNEIFILLFKKFDPSKNVPFQKYLIIFLNNYLKKFYVKFCIEKKHEKQLLLQLSFYSPYYYNTDIDYENYTVSNNVQQLLKFFLSKNIKKKLNIAENRKILKKHAKMYLLYIGFSMKQINKTFEEIKYILKNNLI